MNGMHHMLRNHTIVTCTKIYLLYVLKMHFPEIEFT